jgi:hypothetical protein
VPEEVVLVLLLEAVDQLGKVYDVPREHDMAEIVKCSIYLY